MISVGEESNQLEKVLLPYNLAVPTQLAGTIALDFAAEMEQRVATLVEERGRLFAALAVTDRIQVCPSGANFLMFRVAGDAHELWKRLLERGVLVRDCASFGLPGTVRIAVPDAAGLDRLEAALVAR